MLVAGLDLGGTNIIAGLVGPEGTIGERGKVKTPPGGPAAVVEAMAELVHDLGGEPAAVGVGAPGPVRGGVVVAAPNLKGWTGAVPLADRLTERLGVPTLVANDATAAAVGEWTWGAGRGTRFLLCVTLGTGVGGGLVLDGTPYSGAYGGAGELGHMTVQRGGALCGCGRRGCVEAYAGRASMERSARVAAAAGEQTALLDIMAERGKTRMTSSVWGKALERGDAVATRLVDEAVDALGAGLAAVINLLDLEAVVLAGGLTEQLGQPLADRVAEATWPYLLDREAERTFVCGTLEDDAGLLGAAALARARV